MNIAFFVYHPAQLNFYKFAANILGKNNNVTFYILIKEGIEEEIINSLGFDYFVIGKKKRGFVGKLFNIPLILMKIIYRLKIDKNNIVVSATSPYISILKKIIKIPTIGFTDTETATFNNKYGIKGFDTVLTPDCFRNEIPFEKHIPFKGYKELAYLHPNWFQKDSYILNKFGISPDEKIVLMRFSALKAMHDIGLKSAADSYREKILHYIKELEKYARIFISTTEKELGEEFSDYELNIHPSEYTNFLSFCSLYVGEGTTTASEAGVLGVPWINIQKTSRGYLIDQEEKYGLGFKTNNIEVAFSKALEWIQDDKLKEKWAIKQQKLLTEKIDVSSFLIWFIENYPESHKIMKENSDYQYNFK